MFSRQPLQVCRQTRMDRCRAWGRETRDQYRQIGGEYIHNLSMRLARKWFEEIRPRSRDGTVSTR